MENGAIPDDRITATSSMNDNLTGPSRGRLHLQEQGSKTGGWVAGTSDSNQWLKINLVNGETIITGVATQGRQDDQDWWVKKYRFRYLFNQTWHTFKEAGQTENKVKKTLI